MASSDRYLVTGAAGCIGAWVIRLLLDEGVEVVASDLSDDLRRLDLISLGKPSGRPVFTRLDVTRTDDVKALVADGGITHIVHLAGLQVPFCAANPPLGASVNVVGTANIFEAAAHAGRAVGIAYASSAAVFGNGAFYPGGLVADSSPALPETFYGVYKVANEGTARIYAQNHAVGSIGLRPFVVYGPGRDQGRTADITTAMLAAASGTSFQIAFGGNVLLTHAEDCARAFIDAARASRGSGDSVCLNVPGHRAGVAAIVDAICREVPAAAGSITFSTTPSRTPALLASSALAEAVGTTPNRPLGEGISQTITFFRQAIDAGLLPATQPVVA
jgi:nucleoside-diphosphate-sugar epimerase